MTIDDQLRDLALRADQHQQVITAAEVVQRASSGRHQSSATRARFNGQSRALGDMTISYTEEDAIMIDLDSDTRTTVPRKRRAGLVAAGVLAAAAVVGVALVVSQSDDNETPADQPSVTGPETPLGSIPAGDASIEPGTYLVASSAWSVADFTVTFPEGWSVQDGHIYAKGLGDDEFGFHAVVVDDIWAESCAGSNSGPVDVGPGVDGLTAALLEQPGAAKSGPVETTLGGFPATRIDLSVPAGFDLSACNAADVGLQIWYSEPADMNFVLLDEHTASVYILDIDGERQVFVTGYGPATTDEDVAELQSVLDSIRIEEPMVEPAQSMTTATASASGSIPAGDASIEPGTYLVPSSAWSVADFTVTFPEGWIVEYGHVYAKGLGDGEFGFHAVVVDDVWAESCAGSNSGPVDVGPGVDDLITALLEQPGAAKSSPVETMLGGHPATRIDLTVPDGFDLSTCNAADVGLQIWYSEPALKNFVLIDDHTASVYIVDIDGERQVFVTGYGPATTDEDVAELQSVLDSIGIES